MKPPVYPEVLPEATSFSEFSVGEDLASEAALSSLRTYSETVDNRRAYEHPLRVATILHDFSYMRLSRGVYDAALLHDIAQRVNPVRQELPALEALQAYAVTVETGDGERSAWEYTSTLLADLDEIEACSEQGRHADTGNALVSDLLHSTNDDPVPSYAWEMPSGLVHLDEIDQLLQTVNLESVLVKAAEMLDNLQHPAPKDRAVLQDVFDAESFYAPLCEAIGYDGLSMALRSTALTLRLQKAGKDEAIAEAERILAALGDRDQVISDVSKIFQHVLGGEAIVETPIEDKSGHGVILGDSVLHARALNGGKNMSWVRWREKTLGSLAYKISRLRRDGFERNPADILGITIVTEDIDELIATYRGVATCIKANHIVEARPSPRRTQAFSVQGSEAYVAKVSAALEESRIVGEDEINRLSKNNGHQVAKVTFVYKPQDRPDVEIPVELQIQTKTDWKESRRGKAAHLLYKAVSSEDYVALAAIKERRSLLDRGGLNALSQASGRRFRSLISTAMRGLVSQSYKP